MTVELLVQMRDMASQGLKQLGETGKKTGKEIETSATAASRSIEGIESKASGVRGAMESIRSGVALASGALATLGVSASLGALVASFKNVNAELERLYDLSQATGIEVGKLAGMKFAASQLGTDIESIIGSFRRVSVAIVEARDPLSDSSTMFNALGVSIEKIKDARPEDAFFTIMDALSKQGSEAEKNVIAQQLLGRSYQDLKVIVAAGREEFTALQAEQAKLNPVTYENARAADELGDAWGRVSEAWKGIISSGRITGVMQRFTDNLGTILGNIQGGLSESSQSDPEAARMRGIAQQMETNASRMKEIDLEKAKAAQAAGQAAMEASKQSADASIQAQERVTAFLKSEQDKRDSISIEGIQRMAEREIAEWKSLLDKKLIDAKQFTQARAFIEENTGKQTGAMLEKEFAESDKRIHANAEQGVRQFWEKHREIVAAGVEAANQIREQAAERVAQIYESTTVAGIERARDREIELLKQSGASWAEIEAARVEVTRAASEEIAAIQLAQLEKTGTSMQGVMQGLKDWRESMGTEFTRARAISERAVTSIQGGLSDLIVSAQNSSGGVKSAFAEMARGVAQAIQRMIADMIALQIMKSVVGMASGAMGMFGGGGGGGILSAMGGAGGGGGGVVTNFASGTSSAPGGWSWVGERGPELVRMPRGANVMNNAQSMAYANTHGGGESQPAPTIVQLTINAVDSRSVAQLLMQPESQNAMKETFRGALARDKQTRANARGV